MKKRPRLTPPPFGRSTAWLADRRRDPAPINTGRQTMAMTTDDDNSIQDRRSGTIDASQINPTSATGGGLVCAAEEIHFALGAYALAHAGTVLIFPAHRYLGRRRAA